MTDAVRMQHFDAIADIKVLMPSTVILDNTCAQRHPTCHISRPHDQQIGILTQIPIMVVVELKRVPTHKAK